MTLKKHPKEHDLKLMIDNYWKNYKELFPEINLNDFSNWAEEDMYGGWEESSHHNPAGRRELKMLYVSIRFLKPKNILEIGTHDGTSTNHILLAAEQNQQEGYDSNITTLDIKDVVGSKKLHNFPHNRIIESSLDHCKKYKNYDFIFQDGSHSFQDVTKELELFSNFDNLKFVLTHDYFLHGGQSTGSTGGVKMAIESFLSSNNLFKKRNLFKEALYNAGFHIGIR